MGFTGTCIDHLLGLGLPLQRPLGAENQSTSGISGCAPLEQPLKEWLACPRVEKCPLVRVSSRNSCLIHELFSQGLGRAPVRGWVTVWKAAPHNPHDL